MQRGGIHARSDDAGITPVRIAAQERELELRLDLELRRTRHAQRIRALEALGRDIHRLLHQIDLPRRFHFAQRAEDGRGVLHRDRRIQRREFPRDLNLPRILRRAALRDHVDLRLAFCNQIDRRLELGVPIFHGGRGRRRHAASSASSSAATSTAPSIFRHEDALGVGHQRRKELRQQARVPNGFDSRDFTRLIGQRECGRSNSLAKDSTAP